jgi:hypothetical protein
MIGSASLGFAPFEKKRTRARWANSAFVIIAILGIAKGGANLAKHLGWLTLGRVTGQMFSVAQSNTTGMILGLLLSLILSRQFSGTKLGLGQDAAS